MLLYVDYGFVILVGQSFRDVSHTSRLINGSDVGPNFTLRSYSFAIHPWRY